MQDQPQDESKPAQVGTESGPAAAFKDKETPGPAESPVQIRPAGAEHQGSTPRKWDQHDETLDESFPASDPPSY